MLYPDQGSNGPGAYPGEVGINPQLDAGSWMRPCAQILAVFTLKHGFRKEEEEEDETHPDMRRSKDRNQSS